MAEIYAMSDIHGFYDIMQKNLDLIDLSDKDTKLILCGDFIDYGPDSCKVLYKIKELINSYPSQVVAIKGNHETMFLEFLYAKDSDIWNVEWLGTDNDFSTVNTFITKSSKEKIEQIKTKLGYHHYLFRAAKIIKKDILTNHIELIQWLNNLPLNYETETQIFVHAGIDEEAEEFWKHGTPDEYFVSKFPATFGKFHKDIIAGHISTSTLAKDKDFHDVFWDGESHFFIDGETNVSGTIPVLKYDTITLKYSSFTR
jgi:serine/threonine protein phosphatase 1